MVENANCRAKVNGFAGWTTPSAISSRIRSKISTLHPLHPHRQYIPPCLARSKVARGYNRHNNLSIMTKFKARAILRQNRQTFCNKWAWKLKTKIESAAMASLPSLSILFTPKLGPTCGRSSMIWIRVQLVLRPRNSKARFFVPFLGENLNPVVSSNLDYQKHLNSGDTE